MVTKREEESKADGETGGLLPRGHWHSPGLEPAALFLPRYQGLQVQSASWPFCMISCAVMPLLFTA